MRISPFGATCIMSRLSPEFLPSLCKRCIMALVAYSGDAQHPYSEDTQITSEWDGTYFRCASDGKRFNNRMRLTINTTGQSYQALFECKRRKGTQRSLLALHFQTAASFTLNWADADRPDWGVATFVLVPGALVEGHERCRWEHDPHSCHPSFDALLPHEVDPEKKRRKHEAGEADTELNDCNCLLYTSPSPRD